MEKVIMVNGPEVWKRPEWMINWWWNWLMDGCFPLVYLLMLTYFFVYRKNSGKFPENFPHSIFLEKLQPYP